MTEPAFQLLRPADLAQLTITTVGLQQQTGPSGPQLVASGTQGELIVDLPPQHVGEAVPDGATSTSQARLAGPSRLHFIVDTQPIPLTATGILSAMNRLPLAPRTQGNASTLELPWRVMMAVGDSQTPPVNPDQRTRCVHRSAPATSAGGVTELWHTRMMGGGNAYAPVYPRATLPLESGFAATTPLGEFFDKINAKASQHPDQPMDVEQLILSGCGAWFSGAIRWDNAPSEIDWTHRAAMGRDFYVYVLESGVLFPFGHKAAYVKIVERQFSASSFGNPPVAVLRETHSLAITERSREYGVAERAFPFQAVDLAPPLIVELDQPASTTMFWPMRGGAPLMFSVRGHCAGDVIEMELPLLFSAGAPPEQLCSIYAAGAPGSHSAGPPTADVGRSMAIAMKNDTEPLDGAVHQVDSLTFGGKPAPGDDVGFQPVVTGLMVGLPAVRQLLGQVDSLSARLSDELLASPPGGSPDVVLQLTAPHTLNFGSARAGVVAAPSMAVDRISRSAGPTVAQLPTKPADLFPDNATLLGIVPLSKIIAIGTVTAPTVTWSVGEHPAAELSWSQTLTNPPEALPFTPTPGTTCTVDLSVKTDTSAPAAAAGGPPPVITNGEVKNFTVNIPPENTLLQVQFTDLTFQAVTGALPTASFHIGGASLTGNLAFVQKLQDALPSVGNTAPTVEVTADSITATFIALVPTPLEIGAFTLRNLLLKAAITLSFVNQPVVVEFAFASPEQPFLVAVSGFGGGGYLELAVSAGGSDGGLQKFDGAFEFGACAAMDFGVAAGEVHVFGGVVFRKVGADVEITGYLRIGGMVRVLGLISVSVELTIAMTYIPNMLTGSAKLVITVDLTFWSTSVEIGCSKSFGGSQLSPPPSHSAAHEVAFLAFTAFQSDQGLSVQDALGPDAQSYPWQTYCLAYAD